MTVSDALASFDVLQLKSRANSDPQIARWGRGLHTRFLLDAHSQSFLIDIQDGQVHSIQAGPFVMPTWAFALRASSHEWAQFWQTRPAPGHNDLMALVKRRALKVEGNLQPFMSHLFFFKALLAALRPAPESRV